MKQIGSELTIKELKKIINEARSKNNVAFVVTTVLGTILIVGLITLLVFKLASKFNKNCDCCDYDDDYDFEDDDSCATDSDFVN